MTAPSRAVVALDATTADSASLSALQKSFNDLVKRIGQRRASLHAWEQAFPRLQQTFVQELVPLREASKALERDRILHLDARYDDQALSRADRQAIASLLVSLIANLDQSAVDQTIKAVYDRHGAVAYDDERVQEMAQMKQELEAVLGESLGDDDQFDSPEAILARAHERVTQREQLDATRKQARRAARAQRQGKSADNAASRRAALQVELKQSLRDIYRKLASALHPDREQDPILRSRKTELMQSVNQAYAKQDVLLLLELQVELQQIDRAALDDLGDARLRHYNKLLKEQLGELDAEVRQAEAQVIYGYELGLGPAPGQVTPDSSMSLLQAAIARQSASNAAIENDLAQFGETKAFKRWLKDVKREMKDIARQAQAFGVSMMY